MQASILTDPYNLEVHRQRIEQLYIQEAKSLQDVMEILRGEGCTATRNMFLRKIRSWNLKKNNRQKDMIQYLERINRGEQISNISGRTITQEQVLDYFERRESYLSAKKTKTSQHFTLVEPDTLYQQSQQSQVPATLTLPEPWSSTEQFLHALKNCQTGYITPYILPSCVEEQATAIARRKDPPRSIVGLMLAFGSGAYELTTGETAVGVALIEKGFRDTRYFIENPPPGILSHMISVIHDMQNEMAPNPVSEMVARYLYQLSVIIHGQHHVLTIATRVLFQNWSQLQLLRLGMRLCADTLSSILGKFDPMSLTWRGIYLRSLWNSDDDLAPRYEQFIQDSERTYPPSPGFTLHIKRNYAEYLTRRGEDHRAMAILQDMVGQVDDSNFKASLPIYRHLAEAMMRLVSVDEKPRFSGDPAYQESYHRALELLVQAAESARIAFGNDSNHYIHLKLDITGFQKKWGHRDEAGQEYEQISELLADFKLKQETEQETSSTTPS